MSPLLFLAVYITLNLAVILILVEVCRGPKPPVRFPGVLEGRNPGYWFRR